MASAPALSILPRFPKSLEKERFEGLRTCPERPAIDIAVQSPSTTNVEMPSPSRTKMFGAVRAFIAASLQPVSGERIRSEEHTSELQSLMRISYAVFCLKKKTRNTIQDILSSVTNEATHVRYRQ